MEPFPELAIRPTIVHVRTHALSDRLAPFIRETVLGLRPYVHNVVVARSVDCANPPDIGVEVVKVADLFNPFACLSLAVQLRQKYPSIALVMGHMGNGTRASRLLAEMLGVPLLGTFGGSDVNVELTSDNHRAAYQDVLSLPSAQFLTVAGYLRDKLVQQGAPPDRLFSWHRGVNLRHFQVVARPLRAGRKARLIISARFYEQKGHEYLIRALALLKQRGRRAELLLLGEGPLQEQMKVLVGELGLVDDVVFAGHVSHTEVMLHLRDADVYVHPSVTCREGRTEGVPNAIMEAHAAGLPVVATDHGGIGEVVLDGETGFLVPERDTEALAQRIGQLVNSPDLRSRMGTRGRIHIEAEFNQEIQSRRLAAHVHHTIAAAELFKLRGWPLYPPSSVLSRSGGSKLAANEGPNIFAHLVRPTFTSNRKFIGPIISIYKRAIWAAVFRPYLKLIGRELSSYVGKQLATQAAKIMSQNNPGALHRQLPKIPTDNVQRMSAARCGDCPHCLFGQTWPDDPCPMDAACARTLQREFTALVPPVGLTAAEPPDLRLVDQVLPVTGKLPQDDGAVASIHLSGDLQQVADVAAFLGELRRVLRADGELRLDVWPLPLGRDGGRLFGAVTIPFAQHLFKPEAIEQLIGKPLHQPRRFDTDDLRRWAAEAGFEVAEERPPRHEDPCEMVVQTRFATLLRRTGMGRGQLARAFVATLRPAACAQRSGGCA